MFSKLCCSEARIENLWPRIYNHEGKWLRGQDHCKKKVMELRGQDVKSVILWLRHQKLWQKLYWIKWLWVQRSIDDYKKIWQLGDIIEWHEIESKFICRERFGIDNAKQGHLLYCRVILLDLLDLGSQIPAIWEDSKRSSSIMKN